MNSTKKGNYFEEQVYGLLPRLIENKNVPVSGENCSYHRRVQYFSPDRDDYIKFENVVEVYPTIENDVVNEQPFLSMIFECKNYIRKVDVSEIEEFSSKLSQIKGFQIKGYMVTTQGFQQSALNLAKNLGIGLIRIMPEDQVKFICYFMTTEVEESIRRGFSKRSRQGLTRSDYISTNEAAYFLDSGYYFHSLEQMVNHYIENAFLHL